MSGLVAERPGPGRARSWSFPPFERHQLDSGLHLVTCHLPGRALGSARLILEAGSENEAVEEGGTAVLAARALTEGTELRDAASFAEAAERLGAEIDADAAWDSFQVRATVPVSRMEPALELLGEAARRPAFLASEVERLRAERLNEILQELADPARRAQHAFLESVYTDDSAYARPAPGRYETVAAIDREGVESFYRRFATPDPATLIVAGDLDSVPIPKIAERLFGGWEAPDPARRPPLVTEGVESTFVKLVHRPGSVQSHLLMGHMGVPRVIPDFLATTAMVTVLGGLFSSRLNLRLREEKGYTYGARARFDFRRRPGPFAVTTAVETSVTAAAVTDALGEIARLHAEGVTEPELSEARDFLVGVFPLAFETPEAITHGIAHIVTYGLPGDYYETYRPQMQSVTVGEVDAAARQRLRPGRMAVVVVGDAETLEGPLGETGIGPVTVVEDPQPGVRPR